MICTKLGVVSGSALETEEEPESASLASLALNALLVFLSLIVFGEKSPCTLRLIVDRLDMLELEANVLLVQLGGGDDDGERKSRCNMLIGVRSQPREEGPSALLIETEEQPESGPTPVVPGVS